MEQERVQLSSLMKDSPLSAESFKGCRTCTDPQLTNESLKGGQGETTERKVDPLERERQEHDALQGPPKEKEVHLYNTSRKEYLFSHTHTLRYTPYLV